MTENHNENELNNNEPRAIQIIEAKPDHTFELNLDALKDVVQRPHVRDKRVMVLSVAGAFRKGKSFLLDFLLRYLKRQAVLGSRNDCWIGEAEDKLLGFSWRSGSERDTNGILMWSEPFFVKTNSGDEIVVLLMDTQGSFDNQSTVRDCATIFALSTMISSVQVFNISMNVQEDDLQHLQLFTEYGRLALQSAQGKPFQRLVFLVRDWSFPYEYPYGAEGGAKKLSKILQVSEKQHDELRNVRGHISSCFSHVDCFLMPHPGLKVATSPEFVGQLKDIEVEFQNQLKDLVKYLFSPEKLQCKMINDQAITASDLVAYFESYMKIYQGDELPEPKTMLQATAEANNLAAVSAARELYQRELELFCGGDKPYMKPEIMETHHKHLSEKALEKFKSVRKMGGSEFSEQYALQLHDQLTEIYVSYTKQNEAKNLFHTAKTPLTLFILVIACYLLSGTCVMFGVYSVANIFNIIMGVVILSLCTWAYSRLTGDYGEVATVIDTFAEVAWDNFVSNIVQKVTEKTAISNFNRFQTQQQPNANGDTAKNK